MAPASLLFGLNPLSPLASPVSCQLLRLTAEQQAENQNDHAKQKKGKRDDRASDNASPAFSEEVASEILQRLAQGLQDHNERQVLALFDGDKMNGYRNFANQVDALFQQYDSFRVHFRLGEISANSEKGVATADFEIEESSANGQPLRKHDQLRFEMERGAKSWKIVELTPRGFFS